MAGRKPKPTALKLIQGNAGKRALNKREPKPTGDLDAAPEWMSESQKEGWRYAIENAPKGLLKKLDQSALAVWVIAEDLHREASQKVAEGGLLATSPSGYPIQSPYLPIVNKQAAIMLKAASELGFCPTARARIVLTEEKVENDPWEKLANE